MVGGAIGSQDAIGLATLAGAGVDEDIGVSNALKFAENLDAAAGLVYDTLTCRLLRTLTIPVEDVDAAKPMHSFWLVFWW